MLFNTQIVTVATIFSTLACALPLEGRNIIPRHKSYEVVDVSGGSTSAPEPQVVVTTQIIEVVKPGPTGPPAVPSNSAMTTPTPAPTPCALSSTSAFSVSSTSASSISVSSMSVNSISVNSTSASSTSISSTSISSTSISSTSISPTSASPTSASPTSASTPSLSAIPTKTPEPVIIIITTPSDDEQYYDDGMWHTRYRVKTFQTSAVATPSAAASVVEASALPYNATI